MRLYVGNLAYATTSEGLEEAFSAYGTVESANVITERESGRSKGFGFVDMPDDAEAKEATRALDGTMMDERTIKVNEARPQEPRR
jgi:RNA recognition motif-containing protein